MAAPFYLAHRSSLFIPCRHLILFSLFSFPICVLVRLVCRLASRLVMSSRLMRSVASCRLSCRLTCSSRRLVSAGRLVSRRFVLLFARSRFACRGGLALRSHVVPFLPWHPVSSLRLVGLVSFSPVISFRLTRGRLGSVLVPGFPCSRRSVLLVARSCSPIRSRFLSSVVGRGRVVMAMGRGGAACSCHLIRPLVAPYSLLVRSLRGGGGRTRP